MCKGCFLWKIQGVENWNIIDLCKKYLEMSFGIFGNEFWHFGNEFCLFSGNEFQPKRAKKKPGPNTLYLLSIKYIDAVKFLVSSDRLSRPFRMMSFKFLLTSDGGRYFGESHKKSDIKGRYSGESDKNTHYRTISIFATIPRWMVFFYDLVCKNEATDQFEC